MNDDLVSSDALLAALSTKLRAYVDASARVADETPPEKKTAREGHLEAVRAGRELLVSLDELAAQARHDPGGRSVSAQSRAILDAVLVYFDRWSSAQMHINGQE